MKKYFFLTLAAVVALVASCGKDDPTGNVSDDAILGTWYMPGEYYHPSIPTFKANGEYEWEYGGITGLKDTGTYTKKGNVITMNVQQIWEKDGDRIWHEDGTVEISGSWVKTEWGDENASKVRTCTILMVDEPVLIWTVKGDYFYGEDEMVMIMSRNAGEMDGIDKGLTAKDLEGEYEMKASDGELVGRLILEGNNYTAYELASNYNSDDDTTTKYTGKETGTFSVKDGKITIHHMKYYMGFKDEYDMSTMTWNYTFSNYDPATLESEEWLRENESDWTEEYCVFRDGSNLYYGLGAHAYAWKKK